VFCSPLLLLLLLLLQVIDSVKQTHPQLPIILYISGSGGLLERMAAANPDIISIDQSVDIVDGIKRVGSGFAIQVGSSGGCGLIGG
jgi:uroporphyrinogen decarboxylase